MDIRHPQTAVAVHSLRRFMVPDDTQGNFTSTRANSKASVLKPTSQEAVEAVKRIESISKQNYGAAAVSPSRFGSMSAQNVRQNARLTKAGARIKVALPAITGRDTRIKKTPQLNNLLGDHGARLAAFPRGYGQPDARYSDGYDVEARENGNRDADHACANGMFVRGGGVKPGQVPGQCTGLVSEPLHGIRNLALATDIRQVLDALTDKHLGNRNLTKMFLGYTSNFRGIL